jgi:two-component system, NtrC family, response regulator
MSAISKNSAQVHGARLMHCVNGMDSYLGDSAPEAGTSGEFTRTPPPRASQLALVPDSAKRQSRILVVEHDPSARSKLRTILTAEGFAVFEASDGVVALRLLCEIGADVVFVNVNTPGLDAVRLVRAAREAESSADFVMLTDCGSVETAVEAMRVGAESLVVRPLEPSTLTVVLEKVLEKRRMVREAEHLRGRIRERYRFEAIVGESAALVAAFDIVKRAAPTDATILLVGDSGTGKKLLAQTIHEESPRHAKPFVTVRCAALSETLLDWELFGDERASAVGMRRHEGRIWQAAEGTLFLEEVGDLPLSIQVKLLQALEGRGLERHGAIQKRATHVRLIAATNRDLRGEVAAGRFREDLFYRLNVVAVTLPPLCMRKGDIPRLVSHFIEKFNQAHEKSVRKLDPSALNALLRYEWPGNVRELENVIERAVIRARNQEVTTDELPPELAGSAGPNPSGVVLGSTLRDIEREAILGTWQLVERSTSRAAAILGISPRTIQYRLKEYGLAKHAKLDALDDAG